MDHAFEDLTWEIIEIYQDDLTFFSKERCDHTKHSKKIFERRRKFEISLSPKKLVFKVDKGKLIGKIITKEGIKIDPKRTQFDQDIPPLMS